ncbi:FAS1-like dehydratase domain-containing protein [Sinisalibacter aestuarii]|uniref:FAS1-like dehydratase domain-containing protein n=1 Tax=Sinisalibacter aestuarii TaxID=2949426 RepID=A0ABQ5LXL0_9RHOB|nr:MaoC family dehydratase N-terminal domain-containing protein [Sinisalibacter aestuarii]GKY89140.1 hypothetical protein STA1M1_30090 [Sinisalibacter aestuarii]
MTGDMGADLRDWIGKTEVVEDILTPGLVARFNATLDRDSATAIGAPAPELIHWCLCTDTIATNALAQDGHPPRGAFLPPVGLPRRMWAGGEINLLAPLGIGDIVTRTSEIENIVEKAGRSGPLTFVTLRHKITSDGRLAVNERQDIVYRGHVANAQGAQTPPPAPMGTHSTQIEINEARLFRYSSITFNAHRIHYDAPYTKGVEGYGGLVIHGPLQATLLALFARELSQRPFSRFTYRGIFPAIGTGSLTLHASSEGNEMKLWTAFGNGPVSMEASAGWE